jgi:hypothetical protein
MPSPIWARTPVAFTNTAYYLPVTRLHGQEVTTLGQLREVVDQAKRPGRCASEPVAALPGRDSDSGAATLLAFETIEAVRFARGQRPEPIRPNSRAPV